MTEQIRSAIVTGASRGIGAGIARVLADDGFAVAINYANSPDAAHALVAEIEANGGRAIAVQADLADPEAPRALFDATTAAFGRVDILVNNAGTMQLAPIAVTNEAMIASLMALNLAAPIRLMREAAERLVDGGRIVNLSSSVVGLYQPGYGLYAATKAGVEAITHVLAKELAARGITVNAVAPGPVATELFLTGKTEELLEKIKGMNPFGRLGTPDDIAQVVRFLCSDQSAWVSGQIIRANGAII